MPLLQDAPGSLPRDVGLGASSDAVPSVDSSNARSRACAAIPKREAPARTSLEEDVKDAAEAPGAEEDAEVKWYRDPVVSRELFA